MSDHTGIEWTDSTWNVVTGCDKISPGCKNCYAEGIADRFFAKQYPPNADGSPRKFTDVRCHPERLDTPLHWRAPRMCFVNSMSDLFHEDVPEEFIRAVFTTMRNAQQHTFQVLTKRAARMLEIIGTWQRNGLLLREGHGCVLPNVWLGVSVEDQKRADERIPLLLQTPAAVRFLSVEPMLETVSFRWAKWDTWKPHPRRPERMGPGAIDEYDGLRMLDWVICGGESGPGARMFRREWAESLFKQCREAGVPFFMKQFGSYPVLDPRYDQTLPGATRKLQNRKGGDPEEWPEALRVREFPKPYPGHEVARLQRKANVS
jgi:protein gp37